MASNEFVNNEKADSGHHYEAQKKNFFGDFFQQMLPTSPAHFQG